MPTNFKDAQAYRDRLKELSKMEVAIGLPKDKAESIHYANEKGEITLTLYEVGQIHENGAPEAGIPKRSFIEQPAQMHANDLFKFANSKVVDINNNLSAKTILSLTGELMKGHMVKHIKSGGSGTWAPLKESTIKAKGSSAPLIHTGHLWQSITWEVQPRSK